MKQRWQSTTLVVLVAVMFGYILGHNALFPRAQAQTTGRAGSITCVVGAVGQRDRAPIVMVDSLEQSIWLYEYNYQSRSASLRWARTYRFDKQLQEFGAVRGSISVEAVKKHVEKENR